MAAEGAVVMTVESSRVSEHFPPRVRDALVEAAALLSLQERLERIRIVHEWAVATWPEYFREGA
jgi:hypothetical protein